MNSPRRIKVGLVQMQCTGDGQRNLDRAIELTREAVAGGANVVCLPELFRSLYFCQSEDYVHFGLAETIPGPTTQVFQSLAKELGIVVLVSVFEKRAEGLYHNTLTVIDQHGANLGKYRKMHIPDDPQFYEKFYFTPGDLGFQAFQTDYGKLGTLVCWDQWYPEAARLTALRGAEILFYPTAIGWHPSEKEEYGKAQHESWELIQRSHAVANGCYVVSVNRIGHEAGPDGGIEFWGQSFVAAPNGEILVKGSPDREEVLIVEIDRDMSDFSRTHWPFLRDRRIDAYHEITRRFIDE